LALGDGLSVVDTGLLSWWLSERQLPEGGLNGRPEKLADVCYSWWVLSSLSILHRLHYVAAQPLISFILEAQDADGGGIADRPGDLADPFHTYFGIAALSLLGCPGLQPIDPLYALPVRCIQRLGVSKGKWQTG
jgi:geranylgeranyl transferase type-2 subunit beta